MESDSEGKEIIRIAPSTIARYSSALVKRAIQDLATTSSPATAIVRRSLKILVFVDPKEPFAQSFVKSFGAAGIDVSFVARYNRLEQVYEELSRNPYDMVIPTNFVLTPVSITRLVPEIRSRFPLVKILVISGHAQLAYVNDLARKGADDFYALPFDWGDLVSRTRDLLLGDTQTHNQSSRRITLLLPYYLINSFATLFESYGFKVLWSESAEETEELIVGTHIDLAIEWQHGEEDHPIRDLLKKYGRDTSVLLALNWNLRAPVNLKELGYVDSLVTPFSETEMRRKFLEALPATKHYLFHQTKLWTSTRAL